MPENQESPGWHGVGARSLFEWEVFVRRIRFLMLMALALLAALPARAELSDPDAAEVVERLRGQAIKVSRFQGRVELLRNGGFMAEFFPPSQFYGAKVNVPGVVNKAEGGALNLYLRDEGTEFEHFVARGMGVSWASRDQILGDFEDGRKPRPMAEEVAGQVLDQASPSPSAEASASPSPQPSPSPTGMEAAWWNKLNKGNRQPVNFHPLIFVWPYDLLSWDPRSVYRLKSREEIVFGAKCDLLEEVLPEGQVIQIWVVRHSGQVARVVVPDPEGGPALEATYTRFGPADEATGFRPYSHLEVTQGMQGLYQATMTDAKVNPAPEELLKSEELAGTGPTKAPPPPPAIIDSPVIWTVGLLLSAGLLGSVLLVLAGRFARFRMTRQVFSREVILLDEEDSGFGELLEGFGVSVTPFAPDVLTLERNRLGKGLTAEVTEQPRAVIVGPDAFEEGKGYFFLLEAYLHEGGRILVLPHGPKTAGKIPFKVELVPMPAAGAFQASGIWRSTDPEGVERAAEKLADRHGILRVSGRPLDQVFLRASSGDLQAPLIGVHRRGRGEVLFCQMHLEKGGPICARLLTDLLSWVQGRTSA